MFPSARLRQKENVIPDLQAFEDPCIIVWAVYVSFCYYLKLVRRATYVTGN